MADALRLGRRPSRVGAILVAALLLAGCRAAGTDATAATGDGGSAGSPAASIPTASTPTDGSPTATAADPPSPTDVDPRADGLDVTFGEFAITLEAAAIRPGPVTFVVHNAGQLTHGFEMKIEGAHGSDGDRMKIETRSFLSGETLRVEADLPPGTYEIECFVSDHDERGMRTMLEVSASAPLVTVHPATPSPGTVRIVQFAFVAANIDVTAGSGIIWANEDPTPHTVTADDGAFDSQQLEPGETFSTVLERPGDYPYRCEIHPTMTGTVHVR
jgi:plastocyanin